MRLEPGEVLPTVRCDRAAERARGPDPRTRGRAEADDFGKSDSERDRIVQDLAAYEPLLRATSTAEIDTRAPLDEVVDALERIASTTTGR